MIREVRKGKKIRENNFPCFTIGCKYGTIWGLGHSYQCHKIIQYNEELHDSIKAALCSTRKSIALSTNVKEKLYWGSCAEDYAASHVLKQYQKQYPNKQLLLNDLEFTLPIRPRTLETHPMCTVCKKLFTEKYLCFTHNQAYTLFTLNKI